MLPSVVFGARSRCAGDFVGDGAFSHNRNSYFEDVIADIRAEQDGKETSTKSPAEPDSPPRIEDPNDLTADKEKEILETLRKLMVDDKDQSMDVKMLRQAVSDKVGVPFKTKVWKRWFGDRVADIDDDLAGSGSDDAGTASLASSAGLSDGGDAPASQEVRDDGGLDPPPTLASCSDDFLDSIEDQVSAMLEKATLSEDEIRSRLSQFKKVRFDTMEWKKYINEVVVDLKMDKYADVKEPADIDDKLEKLLRGRLLQIMVADEEMDGKQCRQALTEEVGVVFKSKVRVHDCGIPSAPCSRPTWSVNPDGVCVVLVL